MKSLEKYLQLGLLAIFGFLVFLGMGVYDSTFTTGTEIEPLPSISRHETTGLQYETEKIEDKDIFLVAYQNDSISQMRNLFKSRVVIAHAQSNPKAGEEKVITVEKPNITAAISTQKAENEKKEEPLPTITMKGVVISDNKQALILDVDGKIQILTSQKPLPSGIQLVKVSKEEAVLAYKGREITLKF